MRLESRVIIKGELIIIIKSYQYIISWAKDNNNKDIFLQSSIDLE